MHIRGTYIPEFIKLGLYWEMHSNSWEFIWYNSTDNVRFHWFFGTFVWFYKCFFIFKILLWFFIGSTTVSSSSPGISNFFRTISKKEFIADSAKNQSITVVKALVHQSMSSEGNRISASQTASIETKTTTASNSISQQTTLIESDNSKSSKKRKRRGSKYVRRSDEIDVIQILTDNEEDGKPRKVVEKHSELIWKIIKCGKNEIRFCVFSRNSFFKYYFDFS